MAGKSHSVAGAPCLCETQKMAEILGVRPTLSLGAEIRPESGQIRTQ
jgi:hypothetical protein